MGSFLAVIVYRLPLILHYQWLRDNQQLVNESSLAHSFNLLLPFSHCPNCKHTFRFLEKLPLCAYLYLRGQCAYCQQKIHPRYLLLETLTLICSCIVAYRFHDGVQVLAALILTWGLIVLSGIDCEKYLLPDVLVLPLLWLGLNLSTFHVFVSPVAAILGASVGYLSLWALAKSYGYLAKKEVMGYGDFKCFAMLGAWLGVNTLVNILLIASLLGTVVGCILLLKGKSSFQKPIPFGPFLAVAGWLTLLC